MWLERGGRGRRPEAAVKYGPRRRTVQWPGGIRDRAYVFTCPVLCDGFSDHLNLLISKTPPDGT